MHPVDPLAGPSALQDIVKPQFHQVPISAENYIKNALGVRLDTDAQICRLALSPAGCPLGPLLCPLRHTDPAPSNFSTTAANAAANATSRDRERLSTVCKHWLRGLCKKSDACEFLHEYNLRRMPECRWYAEYGYCSSGDECLYIHPKERKIECPDYKRGFCKLGESKSMLYSLALRVLGGNAIYSASAGRFLCFGICRLLVTPRTCKNRYRSPFLKTTPVLC